MEANAGLVAGSYKRNELVRIRHDSDGGVCLFSFLLKYPSVILCRSKWNLIVWLFFYIFCEYPFDFEFDISELVLKYPFGI